MAVKVFGVGLSKTGTTSLAAALRRLGLRCYDYPPPEWVRVLAAEYDALTDSSVVPHIPRLAWRFPDAKFVLTVRDEDQWIESCRGWWAEHAPTAGGIETRVAVYGLAEFNESQFRRVYRAHTAYVTAFFTDQPGRLLQLNVCDGEGYEGLCPFLGLPIPDEAFPAIRPRGARHGDTIT